MGMLDRWLANLLKGWREDLAARKAQPYNGAYEIGGIDDLDKRCDEVDTALRMFGQEKPDSWAVTDHQDTLYQILQEHFPEAEEGESARFTRERAALLVAIQALESQEQFQSRVAVWMGHCFKREQAWDLTERGDRLAEEVFELLQAHGYDRARIPTLVDYVWGRAPGVPGQEVGGVMVTLAGYCTVGNLDMIKEGERELERICRPEAVERIREKQRAKDAIGFDTPVPGQAKCDCRACLSPSELLNRFVVCAICGNKRCPHANDHRNACTDSNETGQPGSAY